MCFISFRLWVPGAIVGTMVRKNLWPTRLSLCLLVCAGLLVLDRGAQSADAPAQTPQPTDATFEKAVQPFFANHCYVCHNDERQTGDLSLETFKTAASLSRDRATMKLILDKLNAGAMPPPKMPRPKPEDISVVTGWLSHQLAAAPNDYQQRWDLCRGRAAHPR